MDIFFNNLASFSEKVDSDCQDLTNAITSPPLSIHSGHHEAIVKDYILQANTLMNEYKNLTSNTPNTQKQLSAKTFLAISQQLFQSIQENTKTSVKELEKYGFNDEGTLKQILDDVNEGAEATNESDQDQSEIVPLIESSFSETFHTPSKKHAGSMVCNDYDLDGSPTLESFGISKASLAFIEGIEKVTPTKKRLIEISKFEMILNPPTPPFFDSNEGTIEGNIPYVKISPVTEQDIQSLGYLQIQLDIKFLNQVISDINEFCLDKFEFKKAGRCDEISMLELTEEIGIGASNKSKPVLVALIQLKRLQPRHTQNGVRIYRLLATSCLNTMENNDL